MCRFDGSVEAAVGTLVVVNPEGWFVTAAHLLEPNISFQRDMSSVADHKDKAATIQKMAVSAGKKQALVKQLRPNPKWLIQISYWWGRDGVTTAQVEINPLADLAVGQLQPFDAAWVQTYPTFKRVHGELESGTSLCRLGFPFNEVKSTYDPITDRFELAPGTLPLPRFPNEGILTRIPTYEDPTGKGAKFLETSSPGLRGQSGGPVFDREANIYGIQSRTVNVPLGFSPTITDPVTKRQTVEHQFMNLGHAAHVEEVVKLLDKVGATYNLSA